MTDLDKHEFLDRSFIIAKMFENYILEQGVFHSTPIEYQELVKEIGEKLWDLYIKSANL